MIGLGKRMGSIGPLAALLLSSCTLLYGNLESSRGDMGDAGCSCMAPPADQCLDSSTLRVFVSSGSCANASCSYQHWDVLCENGCAAGACIGNDPCDGISCLDPPAPACSANGDLVVYATSGTCSMGFCSYTSTQTTCTTGCANGACTGEPCAGVVCDSPPTSTCSDTSTLTTYGAGACENGACSYAPINTSCASGCANGACTNNPCAGITCDEPPAATCLDATTRRSYSSAGMCTNGACSYAPTDTTCMNGCEGGLCSGNACAGVTCDQPPAPTCTTTTSLRTFATVGTCANGSCSYAPTDTACVAPTNGTASCTSGACGFTCNAGYMPSGDSCVMGTVSSGLTWTQVASGTTDDLSAVWGSGPNDVYAVGDGIILHSTNGGTTWTPTVGTTDYSGVWGSSAANVYITGTSLIQSTNGGVSWNTNDGVGANNFVGLWGASASDIYVLNSQTLYHTTNGGTTWAMPDFSSGAPGLDLGIPFPIGSLVTASSVWGSGPNDVYISGDGLLEQQAFLFHSTDLGVTWSSINVGASGTVWGTAANNLFIASASGTLLHSTDGQNWSPMTTGSTELLLAMWGSSATNLYVSGDSGTLLHSTDGSTWSPVTTGTTNALNGVWGSSASDVYVVGAAGTILHGH
jgi:hypothetical protein